MKHFFLRELMHAVNGPRFIILFFMSSALIITSLFAGYLKYDEGQRWHARAEALSRETLAEQGSYRVMQSLGVKAIRPSSRLSILVSGVDGAVGRAANAAPSANMLLRDSRDELNPVYAVLGELDYAFVVKTVLSLFAQLFSFSAVSGERENGTLRQILSNSVSRASIITGTFLGNFVVFAVALVAPTCLGLVLIEFGFGVQFNAEEWLRVALILLASILYLSLFYLLGYLASTLTRSSVASFVLCLIIWVIFVAVIPRISLFAADAGSRIMPLERVEAQLAEARRERFILEKDLATRYVTAAIEAVLGTRVASSSAVMEPAYDRAKREALDHYVAREAQVIQELRRSESRNLAAAFTFTRLSPVSNFSLAVSRLADTDAALRARYLEQLELYRQSFQSYIAGKIAAEKEYVSDEVDFDLNLNDGENGKTVWQLQTNAPSKRLDVSDAPRFEFRREPMAQTLQWIMIDFALMLGESIVVFGLAFFFFSRYDPR